MITPTATITTAKPTMNTPINTPTHTPRTPQVMNDPQKLKRAIKARESQKKKGKKTWDKLNKTVEKQMAAKQDKRTENLKLRNDPLYAKEKEAKDKAEKQAGGPPAKRQRGQSGAGFEGKRNGGNFINRK